MARLGEITEEIFNNVTHATAVTKLINTAMVVNVQDINSKGVVFYKKANSGKKQRRTCTELRSALLTEFNVDEGTTSGVSNIPVTVIQQNSVVFATPKVFNLAIQQIIEVQPDKDSATDSRIEYQNFSGKTEIYIVDDTVAAIKALANA